MVLHCWVIVSFATTLSIITAADVCGTNQYNCGHGQCISLDNLCDGTADCSDGNDETHPICRRISARSDGACVLPPYPDLGTYTVENSPEARPGQTMDFFKLTVSCRRGYGLDPYSGSNTQQVYCIKGKWLQKMPKCVRFCRLDPDPSVRYLCYTAGVGVETCKNYVPPGTMVDPVCNSPIYYTTEVLKTMKCTSGFWNYVALCKAECGRITPGAKQLVVGGRQVKRGELPWHVGIYRKNVQSYLQICGGSLISNNLVISAAHCFWRSTKKLLPSSEFKVAAGKLYRSWDSEEDVDAQKSDVNEIRIPSLFAGEAANFQEDIAVLILANPFVYTTYIRPICLDFGSYFDMLQLQHGKLGKVAGWGLNSANGKASETLLVINIPFIDDVTCISTLPDTFRENITGDKFCAGYNNGTALCQGDSGEGLAFSDSERGIERFYLRGVVSAAPNDDGKLCNVNTYIAFTKITKHQDLIKGALAASEKKICPLYSFQCTDGSCVDLGSDCNGRQDCADGSDESDEYCLVATRRTKLTFENSSKHLPVEDSTINTNGTDLASTESKNECGIFDIITVGKYYMRESYMPWLVAVYTKSGNEIRFICGGSLISKKHVITIAHLLPDTASIIVRFGSYSLNVLNIKTVRSVTSAEIAKGFDPDTLINDLSILTMDKFVDFNENLKPVCLWNGKTNLDSIVGEIGVFFGWSNNHPRYYNMSIVSIDTCRDNNKPYEYLLSDKILCAEKKNFSTNSMTITHSGGLYLRRGGKWRLRGLLIEEFQDNIPNTNIPSTHNNYVVFVDTAQYLPWITKILEDSSV